MSASPQWLFLFLTIVLSCEDCAGPASQSASTAASVPRPAVATNSSADTNYAAAKQKRDSGDKVGAKRDYERVIADYKGTTGARDAAFDLGEINLAENHFAEAKRWFGEFLLDAPTDERAPHARRAFAQAALQLGDFRDAVETLKTLLDDAPAADKAALAVELRQAAIGAGDGAALLRAQMVELDLAADDAARAKVRQEILDAIEHDMGQGDIDKLVEQARHDKSALGFAYQALLLKAAKIHFHVAEPEQASQLAHEVIDQASGSSYAQAARALLDQLTERSKVRVDAIGVVLPLSGNQKFGASSLVAIKLALGITDDNGANGINLVVRDSANDPEKAAQAVADLVEKEHVIGIIGPLFSEESRAAAAKAESEGVPLINLSRRDGIPEVGPNVFRLCLTAKQQAQALVHLLFDIMGYHRVAMLYPNAPAGAELANQFWDEVENKGGEMRGVETFDYDQTTFMTPVKKLAGRYWLDARADYLHAMADIYKEKGLTPIQRQREQEKLLKSLPPITDFDALFIPGNAKQVGYIAPALAFEDIIVTTDKEDLKRIEKTTGRSTLR